MTILTLRLFHPVDHQLYYDSRNNTLFKFPKNARYNRRRIHREECSTNHSRINANSITRRFERWSSLPLFRVKSKRVPAAWRFMDLKWRLIPLRGLYSSSPRCLIAMKAMMKWTHRLDELRATGSRRRVRETAASGYFESSIERMARGSSRSSTKRQYFSRISLLFSMLLELKLKLPRSFKISIIFHRNFRYL